VTLGAGTYFRINVLSFLVSPVIFIATGSSFEIGLQRLLVDQGHI
jgi:hypothetical protein